jgi:hypothetical protein
MVPLSLMVIQNALTALAGMANGIGAANAAIGEFLGILRRILMALSTLLREHIDYISAFAVRLHQVNL